jgi:hypothetical protein
MTIRVRTAVCVSAGALVLAVTGCDTKTVNKIASNASVIEDYANKLQAGQTAVYQARYANSDGSTVIVQQRPPESVFVSATGPWIFDGTTSYLCDNSTGTMTCTKTVYSGSADINAAFSASVLAAGGFLAAGTAIVLITRAALDPGAQVTRSDQTIAGQHSSCVAVTGLTASPGSDDPVSFTVCITDSGVLARYSGTDANGTTQGTELTAYTVTVDPTLFEPPPGAQIIDSTSPFPSGPPSTPASPVPGGPVPSPQPSG